MPCTKRPFTESEARTELATCIEKRRAGNVRRRETAVYHCHDCNAWHLSSLSPTSPNVLATPFSWPALNAAVDDYADEMRERNDAERQARRFGKVLHALPVPSHEEKPQEIT